MTSTCIVVVFTWKLHPLPCFRIPVVHIFTHTHMHRHTAPLEYMETITGSTLAGPPLYLPIHPRFLSWVWVMSSGDAGWSEEMSKSPPVPPGHCWGEGKNSGGGGGAGLSGPRLNPAAFCCPSPRPPELSALRGLDVSQLLTCGRFRCLTSRDAILDYVRVSWSQISTQGEKLTLSQLVVIPQRGTDGGKVGVTKPQECPWQPLWSFNCGRNNSQAASCLFYMSVTVLPSSLWPGL